MSLNSIMNTAGSAMGTYQSAINVTGQNIANVDNPDYSIQNAEYTTNKPVNSGGQTYGSGVNISSVNQEVNQILENSLTSELSSQSALNEAMIYMNVIEDLFSEDSDDSLNTLLDNYWNAWEDLGNNPSGTAEQAQVYDAGQELSQRVNDLEQQLVDLSRDLDQSIAAQVDEVNALTEEIAQLNQAITVAESTGANANDLRDRRNGLVDDLGEIIDINVTTKQDGSFQVSTGSGLPLVDDQIAYSLEMQGDRICWCGSGTNTFDITDKISGGSLAGQLEIRDAVIPEIQAELNQLSSQIIWSMNYQHSQGAGQSWYSGEVEGSYEAGKSGTLDSLFYGDQIDYTKDFSMVIQDNSGNDPHYQTVNVDMGISSAELWGITGDGPSNSTYQLTVVDEGVLGEQNLAQTATGGGVSAGDSISQALDGAMAEQTLTIDNGTGVYEVQVSDDQSGAGRSAADIAKELNDIDGVQAYASPTRAEFSMDGVTEAQDGDWVSFDFYADGRMQTVEFQVDSSQGSLEDQLETALADAVDGINQANQNTDLAVDGLVVESVSGATLGVENFEVRDNAGVMLNDFQNFNADDTLTLTLETDASPATTVDVEVDLTGVDTTDSAAVAQAVYDALDEQLADTPFTVEMAAGSDEIILRTTDGSGMNLSGASGDTGDDASFGITALSGSSITTGDGRLDFNGTDQAGIEPQTSSDDYIGFSLPGCDSGGAGGAVALVGEAGSVHNGAAVLTGSVTLVMDPGVEITSSETSSTGLFGAGGTAGDGNSMITLGGEGGYDNFDVGDQIEFEVDGHAISYTVAAPATDADQAEQLAQALEAGLPADGYEVISNGTSVSVVRTGEADDPIAVTGFADGTSGDAALAVSTGTGTGVDQPDTARLLAGDPANNSAQGVTWGDPAIIQYEVLDSEGRPTGESGFVEVDEAGMVEIPDGDDPELSFQLSTGSLVAGNTLRINTNDQGQPDPLDVTVAGKANSPADTYEFTVASGGSVSQAEDEPLVLNWTSETGSGTVVIEDNGDPNSPTPVEVDGMTLYFNGGTLVEGDVFYLDTDANGEPLNTNADGEGTVRSLSDWHWTMDSFAHEFNRNAGGVTASVSSDNTLVLDSDPDYHALDNVTYSGADGISEENTRITMLDHTAMDLPADDLQFVRTNGSWEIKNDPTGGKAQIIPEGGDDDGFQVDLDGDGIGDMEVKFQRPVTGDGTIGMDFTATDPTDFSYAFAGSEEGDSGLAAALGLNTFFTGTGASDMGVNELMADGEYLATGLIDPETGTIASGDNSNALAMADTRNNTLEMKQWDYSRGNPPTVTVSETSLDEYQSTLSSSVGLTSRNIQSSLDYSDQMVYQLTAQRDAVSAANLDEEMVNLTAQQQAYEAAAQLMGVVDEMFDTLLNIR